MRVVEELQVPLASELDLVMARNAVREAVNTVGYRPVAVTGILTAASELARNALVHGGGGKLTIQRVCEGTRHGVRLIFSDDGPGIADVELALSSGYSGGGGLGLGLPGSRRLVDEFEIESEPGRGTRATICKWAW